jgi:CubicO group peptidase (beta-lactamase class C family)
MLVTGKSDAADASPQAAGRGKLLPSSSPASQGADSRKIEAFLGALESAPGLKPHSLMILRHGKVIAQGWWAPYTPDHRQLLYSLSKSFTAAAAALASAEGLLRLDDPAVSHFPEFEAEIVDPRSRSILLRHLLSMASGHSADQWGEALTRDVAEPVRGFLLGGPDNEPGAVFAYNQPCTYTIAAIVQRASGQRLVDYLRPRLLDPLGIGDVAWQQHPAGRDQGFSGLHAATDAIAKLGQLYLQRGVWDGVRLLPEEWVEQATRPQIANPGDGVNPDWEQGYGFQFWMSRHGYRGDGAFGQYCLVLPEQDAVVAITSETTDLQAVLGFVWEHLLPALDEGPAADAELAAQADAALAQRLAALSLRPAPGSTPPRSVTENLGPNATLVCTTAPAIPDEGTDVAQQGPIAEVHLTQSADGTDDWILTLVEAEDARLIKDSDAGYEDFPRGAITVRLAPGSGWRVSAPGEQPIAVSGGWTDPDTLRVDILFLETPHSLEVTCDTSLRTVQAHFVTTFGVNPPLTLMRAPLNR